MGAYRRILGWAAPSLDEVDLDDAVLTHQELSKEARSRGIGSWFVFMGREIRSVASTAVHQRIRRGGASTPPPGQEIRPPRSRVTDGLAHDLKYALRTLRRAPGFVVVTLASLTFATAVSTVVFSVLNATLLRPLPVVQAPEDLVQVFTHSPRWGRGPNSFPDFEEYRAASRTLTDLAAVRQTRFAVGPVSEGTRQIPGLQVSDNYFQVLGVSPLMGRAFLPEDVDAGGRVVIIGYNTWQHDFNGDAAVLGRSLYLNGQPYTVVGVAPPGLVSVDSPLLVEIAVPLMDDRDRRGWYAFTVVGRRSPGVTMPQVQAEFDAIAAQLAEAHPDSWEGEGSEAARSLLVLTNSQARIPEDAPLAAILLALGGVVGFIMLIACSNVANLLLTRALRRRGEIAVRSAIGAPAGRVVRQLLMENLILFGMAGALGLLATYGLAELVRSGSVLLPPPGIEISIDQRVALFALVLSVGTGMTFGLIPALQTARPDIVAALRGLTPVVRFRALGIRNLLVGAQVGGSLVMVLVTFLLLRSLDQAGQMDLGFDPTGIATLSLDVSHAGYGSDEGGQLYADLLERVSGLPGVEAAGLASWVPLAGGSTNWGGLEPEGYELGPDEYVSATMAVVTPGYLDLTRMRLQRGRDFTEADTPESVRVVMVNQTFVDRYWPGEDGVGRHIGTSNGEAWQVVGVVKDVTYRDLTSEIRPHIWLPLAQAYRPDLVLHARTRGDAQALLGPMRRELATLMPDVPVIRADLMENISASATLPHRIFSAALGTVGLFALLLSMLGIYGVVGYSVSQRTREMGLRMALGAEPRRVVRLVLREGLVLAMVGLVPGLLLALAASRLLDAVLIGVSPLDPVAFISGVALLVAAVVGASLVPGIRAARAHPMESLRVD